MPCLRMGLFGSLQIQLDDSPITTVGSNKARALLVYLATEADQPHRRDQLTGLLWPDCPENIARNNLRQTVFSLRQAIGDHTATPPFLTITRSEIQFNTESDYFLDVASFNVHLAVCVAHKHPSSTICEECASHMQQAADLYRGRFLEQFFLEDSAAFEEWALIQREALHRSVLEALAHLVDHYEQCADLPQARRCASRQLELDPWREEAHRQMMRVLALNGQRSEALVQYETCRRVLADELGVEPSAETRELQVQISQGTFSSERIENPPSLATTFRPLPLPLTPFIGRDRELIELGRLLVDRHCRLITLIGIGGVGKTRLALQAADRYRKTFAQGAVFVPLASIDSSELVVPAIAEALGLVFASARDPRDLMIRYLRDKQMLLVLDNLEHLLDSADLLVDILHHAPEVKLLCTSRESLHLQSEWAYAVEGLPVPENERTDKFEECDAVALFAQHARRARAGYALTVEERSGVARICHLVEGMPLALELAATWSRILSSGEIADQIERDVGFLTAALRDVPERHRGMHAVFDKSWSMLTTEEQHALSKLSVFRGGIARQAAEHVAGASLSILAALANKSLVRRTASDRYDLHELVRQYASERLAAEPAEQAATLDRHSEYYLTLVKHEESRLCSDQQKAALARLAPEVANIRIGLERAIDMHQMALLRGVSFPLLYLYEIRGWFREGESLFRDAAARLELLQETDPQHESSRQIALLDMRTNQAYFSYRLGKSPEAYPMHRQCSDRLRSLGDKTVLRYSLRYCGLATTAMGRFDEAQLYLGESRDLSRAIARRWDIGIDNAYLGHVARYRGVFDQAKRYYGQGLAIARSLGDRRLIAANVNGLCSVLLALDRHLEASDLLEQVLLLAEETGDRYSLGVAIRLSGQVAERLGDTAKARRLFEQSIELLEEIGATHQLSGIYVDLGYLTLAMGETGEAENLFRIALKLATQTDYMLSWLDALVGLASARARIGSAESAMELVALVTPYLSGHMLTRNRAEQLRAELETQLTPEATQAIDLRARFKTLQVIAEEILAAQTIST